MSKLSKNITQAIYDTVHQYKPGGARGLAEKLGVRPGIFNNKCDPNFPDALPNISEIVEIIKETKNPDILHVLAAELSYVCVKIEDWSGVADMELLDAWAEWDAERGETVQEIRDSLSNSVITKKEFEKIKSEMFEDFQKELELLTRLEGYLER